MKRTVWHILSSDSRSRADQARAVFSMGQHAEVYDNLSELLRRAPSAGIILAGDNGEPNGARHLIESLNLGGVWLPVVMTAHVIVLDQVVAAMSAGALDYLSLPLDPATASLRLELIIRAAEPHAERRRVEVQAAQRLAALSPRELQVLELLSGGHANKDIARELQISPRTVEIHRAKMMGKIGAKHTADAVRAWLAARVIKAPQHTLEKLPAYSSAR